MVPSHWTVEQLTAESTYERGPTEFCRKREEALIGSGRTAPLTDRSNSSAQMCWPLNCPNILRLLPGKGCCFQPKQHRPPPPNCWWRRCLLHLPEEKRQIPKHRLQSSRNCWSSGYYEDTTEIPQRRHLLHMSFCSFVRWCLKDGSSRRKTGILLKITKLAEVLSESKMLPVLVFWQSITVVRGSEPLRYMVSWSDLIVEMVLHDEDVGHHNKLCLLNRLHQSI